MGCIPEEDVPGLGSIFGWPGLVKWRLLIRFDKGMESLLSSSRLRFLWRERERNGLDQLMGLHVFTGIEISSELHFLFESNVWRDCGRRVYLAEDVVFKVEGLWDINL